MAAVVHRLAFSPPLYLNSRSSSFFAAAPSHLLSRSRGSSAPRPLLRIAAVSTAPNSSTVDEVCNTAPSPNGLSGSERVALPTNASSEKLLLIFRTCAHVMAMAVQKQFPQSKVTIGPWIENGFYYDVDMVP